MRVTRHQDHVIFDPISRVDFIFPKSTSEIFSFVKYNELNMRLVHPKSSFGQSTIFSIYLHMIFFFIQLLKVLDSMIYVLTRS